MVFEEVFAAFGGSGAESRVGDPNPGDYKTATPDRTAPPPKKKKGGLAGLFAQWGENRNERQKKRQEERTERARLRNDRKKTVAENSVSAGAAVSTVAVSLGVIVVVIAGTVVFVQLRKAKVVAQAVAG